MTKANFLRTGKPFKWHLNLVTFGSLLVGFLAVSSAIATAFNPDWLESLELQTQTLFFRLRGQVTPPANIVILAIDDSSFARGDDQGVPELAAIRTWPWRRTAYADAIAKLMAAGAKAVVLDLVFDVPSNYPQDDQKLQQVLEKYKGRVTLAAVHNPQTEFEPEKILLPDPLFQTNPQSIGLINYLPEANGDYRRIPSQFYTAQIDPDLRRSQDQLTFFAEAALQTAQMPFPPVRGEYIFFYGGQNTFPTVPFWWVLFPKNWEYLQKEQTFKDKIVLIGPTAAPLQDNHPTPFGKVPGVEIHANAIATLIENRALSQVFPHPLTRGVLVLLGVAGVGFAVSRLSKRTIPRAFMSLGLAVVWAGVGYLCFSLAGWIVPVAVPVLAIALSGLSFLGTGAISDLLEKLHLRRTLERYVAAPIVEEILNQPDDYQELLQGRKLNAAVMFCDIRGFTTLSYKLPPEELVAQLNVYLNAMVGVIVEARGTIDKFIGDAVMAEFGSPVSQGETTDAMNAIRAAIGMRRALAELREQWKKEGKTLLYNGIGISYGEVIAGNIGSMQRLEYTVIGDAVNVASRVEGLTKNFCTDILITGPLYDLIKDEINAVYVGEHQLRGREGATRLYSVISFKNDDPSLYRHVRDELRHFLGFKELKDS